MVWTFIEEMGAYSVLQWITFLGSLAGLFLAIHQIVRKITHRPRVEIGFDHVVIDGLGDKTVMEVNQRLTFHFDFWNKGDEPITLSAAYLRILVPIHHFEQYEMPLLNAPALPFESIRFEPNDRKTLALTMAEPVNLNDFLNDFKGITTFRTSRGDVYREIIMTNIANVTFIPTRTTAEKVSQWLANHVPKLGSLKPRSKVKR